MTAAVFTAPTSTRSAIGDAMTKVIRDASNGSARSRQSSIGPSEMGDPCSRRIAHRLYGTPKVNKDTDPWPSIVGTGTHAWLEDAFRSANTDPSAPEWIVEQRVPITGAISGSCDLFHAPTLQVIDHKVVGTAAMKKYKTSGPGSRYRAQIHLYGYGWQQLGIRPELVTIAFFSRPGWLSDLWTWSEPYDEQVARDALTRIGDITDLLIGLDIDNHPERWALVPNDAADCVFCPFYRPGPAADATGCPGPTGTQP